MLRSKNFRNLALCFSLFLAAIPQISLSAVLQIQIEEAGRISSEKVLDLSKADQAKGFQHGLDTKIALEVDDGVISCGVFLSRDLQGSALVTALNLVERKSNSNSINIDGSSQVQGSTAAPSSPRRCKLFLRRS